LLKLSRNKFSQRFSLTHKKNTALARPQPHKPNASSVFYGIATVCNCHTFCVVFCQRSTAHRNPRSCGYKELYQCEKNKAKRHFTPTTTTVPFMPVCKSVEAYPPDKHRL